VPALWPFEVANALAVADRRQRITQEGIVEFLETLQRLPIQIERREALWLWQAVLPLTRQHRLSAYDAAYLELAKREKMQSTPWLRSHRLEAGISRFRQ
jgi:predicted nucleic acid-binding protein